jgi:tetratricopeptide (TPR) repeat protein
LAAALQHFVRQQPERALEFAERAASAATGNSELLGVATLLLRFGRPAKAVEVFRAMLASDSRSITALANIAQLEREHDAAELAAMLELAEITDPDRDSGIQLNFALGKTFADLGDFDRSFAFYAKGNAGRRKQVDFQVAAYHTRLRHVRMAFQKPLFERLAGAGVTSFRPIFIVGMPRSGSTLVEQILASHPQAHGGDELPLTTEVVAEARRKYFRSSVSDLVSSAQPAWIADMARAYIRGARPLMGKKPRLADKYLDNFWNVGLLRLMFPQARIIHCQRDPLDNGLSIYRRHFADPGPNFAYDLGEIGAYYKMQESLMRHWDDVLPGFVMHVRYEDIVTSLEPSARALLAFCDLPWDDRCLAFHHTERPVKTASHAQVRKPLYRDAIGSARPYLAHLGPLIEALR